jgi:chemotaxis protein MotB
MATARQAEQPEEREEGAPAWMVTFGDMMSLLLAFFVMLFSISEIKQEKFSAAVSSLQEYFNLKGGAQTSNDINESLLRTYEDVYIEFVNGMGEKDGGQDFETAQGENPRAQKIREGITTTVGGVVTFAERSSRLQLDENGQSAILEDVASKVRGYHFKIEVVGHVMTTEVDADGSARKSLRKLSIARAEAVTDYLVDKGKIRAQRIRVSGESAHDPVVGQTEQGRARNRRVEIVASERKILHSGE